MSRHPTIKWAQRSDKIFLTVDLPDANDVKLKLEPQGRFVFSATKGGIPYEVDIELYDKINAEKTESKWWNRLLKQEGKPPVFLKVDWDKWVDEDDETEGIEEEEEENKGDGIRKSKDESENKGDEIRKSKDESVAANPEEV
ncbi:hypothetical protein C5167_003481 [Papaver somniferum]|uniref:Co-chaperone protein p23 n=1 Tax=Papaver somniferum TaxID=3469 RepID=A0A4Y7L464_PAPSO|nr:hypothetical protein C5167_003481 [Papaver somniferum]